MADLLAGAGRARIVLAGSESPLKVRVLLLDDGIAPVTLAVVDRVLPAESYPWVTRVLGRVTHVTAESVLVCAGHDDPLGEPLVAGEDVRHAIEDAVAWAAFAARSTCRPARPGRGGGGGAAVDRIEDLDGRPIALLIDQAGAPGTPDAIEHGLHDEAVVLFLSAAVAERIVERLPS